MKESNMPKADFLMSIVLMLFGIFVMIASSRMPDLTEQNSSIYSAPGVVPNILGFVFVFLGLIMFIRSIRKKGYRLGFTWATVSGWFKDKSTHRFLLTLGLSVGYAMILLGRMHYLLATGIYMFLFVYLFEYRKGVKFLNQKKTLFTSILIAILTSGIVYWIFRYLFLVNLPG